MRNRTRVLILAAAALVVAVGLGTSPLAQQARGLYAIQGGQVFTAVGEPIASGTVLVKDGVIEAIGANVTVPPGAGIPTA